MRYKTCIGCSESKPETEFRWKIKAKNIRIPRCQECDKKYRARYYRDNLIKARENNHRATKKRRERVAAGEIKEQKKKRCSNCKKIRSIKMFRWRNKTEGRRIPRCRHCDKIHRAQKYKQNKTQYLENNKRQYKKLRVILESHKKKPCTDCGQTYPTYVMDFDHVNSSTKRAKVSYIVYMGSEKLLLDEIAKCEVVCSNCHRIRTHQRKKETSHE